MIEHTGFDFDRPADVPTTAAPTPETLALMRTRVAHELAEVYPQFASIVFGVAQEPVPLSENRNMLLSC